MSLLKRLQKTGFGQALLAWEISVYLLLLRATTRWRITRPAAAEALLDKEASFIACFWHGRLTTMRAAWNRHPSHFHMLISGHRDGAMVSRAMQRLGFPTVAGSSRRGGVSAMRRMREILQSGDCVGITPDGPRGPRMRAKIGAIKAAQSTGVPILPVTGSIRRCRFLKTWDRFCFAEPFSRGVILFGEPLSVPADADRTELERLRLELENRLNALTAEADRLCGHPAIEPAPPGEAVKNRLGRLTPADGGSGKVHHAGA